MTRQRSLSFGGLRTCALGRQWARRRMVSSGADSTQQVVVRLQFIAIDNTLEQGFAR